MTSRRHHPIAALMLALSCLSLGGCFWGLTGTGVIMKNETDDVIYVDPRGELDINEPSSIRPGDERRYSFSAFDFGARFRVSYRGRERIYRVNPNFLGIDWIHVNTADFPPLNN